MLSLDIRSGASLAKEGDGVGDAPLVSPAPQQTAGAMPCKETSARAEMFHPAQQAGSEP